jgi:hypothetical protein
MVAHIGHPKPYMVLAVNVARRHRAGQDSLTISTDMGISLSRVESYLDLSIKEVRRMAALIGEEL